MFLPKASQVIRRSRCMEKLKKWRNYNSPKDQSSGRQRTEAIKLELFFLLFLAVTQWQKETAGLSKYWKHRWKINRLASSWLSTFLQKLERYWSPCLTTSTSHTREVGIGLFFMLHIGVVRAWASIAAGLNVLWIAPNHKNIFFHKITMIKLPGSVHSSLWSCVKAPANNIVYQNRRYVSGPLCATLHKRGRKKKKSTGFRACHYRCKKLV